MQESDLLLVTSFNQSLYEATGKRLIESYNQTKQPYEFLVTYDGDFIPKCKFAYNLTNNKYLLEFCKKYNDIIPIEYGGTYNGICNCKLRLARLEKDNWNRHKVGCPNSKWNKRASKWFRKVVALKIASELDKLYILFIDSDVYFTQTIPIRFFQYIFNEKGIVYHFGKLRYKIKTGVESGIIGFSQKDGGFKFIDNLLDYYLSGAFLKEKRWDDGYLIKLLIQSGRYKTEDLVPALIRSTEVVQYGPFAKYLVHEKGIHYRRQIV